MDGLFDSYRIEGLRIIKTTVISELFSGVACYLAIEVYINNAFRFDDIVREIIVTC